MPRRGENIYKRKDGRWEGRVRGQGNHKKYRSVYGKTYREVKTKLESIKSEQMHAEEEGSRGKECCTVTEAAGLWLRSQRNDWKPGTYAAYKQTLEKYILPYLGEKKVDSIDNETMECFAAYISSARRKGNLSSNYLFQICSEVRRILLYINRRYCYGMAVPANPVARRRTAKTELPGKECLALLENYLVRNCSDDTCLGILIAFHTGIRIGELSALTWKDINIEEAYISIRRNMMRVRICQENGERRKGITQVIEQTPKTSDSTRVIPISARLLSSLKAHYKDDGRYVVSGTKNLWAEPRTIQYRFQRILQKCGIEPFHFHMLRHAFATRCVTMGLDIKSLSEILGHSNIQITLNLYVHSDMRQKKRLMEQYDMLLEKTAAPTAIAVK
ncbi:MAG: site-specific integrase [Lachnospiraceae bacterium]|nr:site-specific integrase [Lachnospiraceae bacterium]